MKVEINMKYFKQKVHEKSTLVKAKWKRYTGLPVNIYRATRKYIQGYP